MLTYAHINLLSMLSRIEPEEVVKWATDSIYIGKSALKKLEGVEAYKPHLMHPKGYCCICLTCHEATPRPRLDGIAQAQWRDKGEQLYKPMEHAAYLAKPEYIKNKIDLAPNTAPCHDDPLSRHRLSYLNGGGGSGKTTRSIKLFRTRNPPVLTPTHRLAKEMRSAQAHRRSNRRSAKTPRGVKAHTYQSFFRWSGQTDWRPEGWVSSSFPA